MFENLPFFKKKTKTKPYRHNFNLLRPARPKLAFVDKLYLWMSGTCRVIIIFIELSVIVSLGYRFYIDRNSNDLKSEVNSLVELLDYRLPEEKEILRHTEVINIYDTLKKLKPTKVSVIPEVYPYTKSLVRFDLILTETDLNLSGQAKIEDISSLENFLKSSTSYKDVTITSLTSSSSAVGSNLKDFVIHAEIIN